MPTRSPAGTDCRMVWDMVMGVWRFGRCVIVASRPPRWRRRRTIGSLWPPSADARSMDRRRFVTTLAAASVPVRALAQAPGKVARVGFLSSAPRPTDAAVAEQPVAAARCSAWAGSRGATSSSSGASRTASIDLLARFARELVDAQRGRDRGHGGHADAAEVRHARLDAADRRHLQRPRSGRRRVDRELRPAGRQRHRRVAHARRDARQAARADQDHAARGATALACCSPLRPMPGASARRSSPRLRDAARAVHVDLAFHPYRSQDELMAAFPALAAARTSAFLLEPTFQTFANRGRIAELAIQHRLPGVFTLRQYADAGGLHVLRARLADAAAPARAAGRPHPARRPARPSCRWSSRAGSSW